MTAAPVSPELVLVDRELRESALAALPPVEPFDFLRFDPVRLDSRFRRPPALEAFGFLTGYEEAETYERRLPVWVAAPVYTIAALAKVIVVNAVFVVAIAVAVALLQLV